jgi:hypothetical protein
MEGGHAQDSGVETEFDMESNDSSMSRYLCRLHQTKKEKENAIIFIKN